MFLAVDVGNTQTTLGLFDEKGCVARQWRMATDATDTSDELHERLYGYSASRWTASPTSPSRASFPSCRASGSR